MRGRPISARILYVQNNSEVGGSDIALLRLVRALDPSRFRPVVLLPADGPIVPLYRQAGAEVRFTPMRQLRTLPSPSYQLRYVLQLWPTVRRIVETIKAESIALVHTNSLYCLYGGWAARAAGVPHVWHVREMVPRIPVALPIFRHLVRGSADAVIAISRACIIRLVGHDSQGWPIDLVPDCIDPDEFSPAKADGRVRRELHIGESEPLVGFVARLDPWKGLEVFLRAAALVSQRFPKARFIVAGAAPAGFEAYERRMRRLSSALDLSARVQFLGFRYGAEEMPHLMAALDVFCHTAIKPEPFGLVLIEAMAMARPVIASRAGGPMEIILDDDSGMLTPPGDVDALSQAVCSLLADPGRARAMGLRGRQRVEQTFSLRDYGPRVTRVYERVLRTV